MTLKHILIIFKTIKKYNINIINYIILKTILN